MELSLFLGDEGAEKNATLTKAERDRQAMAFAWAHAAPLSAVLRHVRDKTWSDEVDLFEFRVSIDSIPSILAEIQRVAEQAGEASVDVVERSGSTSGEKPPGN
ncbi:hypothetical protein [Verrucomicrobium sp. BvORR106]|uniref:hypothetical protein n=1 Tax=Verrucomicrobium sp. BvORR106 TaxID=1403819 RepID=UPI002240EC9C|nr:hypothetical protein [Verrucomicrobium sp. BvORR106]